MNIWGIEFWETIRKNQPDGVTQRRTFWNLLRHTKSWKNAMAIHSSSSV
nr:MAG TPA: hypothetical protein [Caudoviricetes sp.]DAJ46151.1 MAG TPA: hypothetical protein [Caudoviricetes sp.]DAT89899.1 MAG TPA: hypothetical protein [Caudoviricetes sp.]DAV29607.1 MAG TPA: hypothetical protein [Caudoviricetes sp.]